MKFEVKMNGRGTAERWFLFFVGARLKQGWAGEVGYGYISTGGGSRLNEKQLLYAIARSRLYFKYFYTLRGVCYLCAVKPRDALISDTK